jgi:hypothetical protein
MVGYNIALIAAYYTDFGQKKFRKSLPDICGKIRIVLVLFSCKSILYIM